MTAVELWAAAVSTPPLPDAACRGQSKLFDATVAGSGSRDEVVRARFDALTVCRGCAVLQQCREWYDSLPPGLAPQGVVAGRVDGRATQENRRRSMAQNELGDVLRSLRMARHWRQRDLAERLNTGQNRVGAWEAGQNQPTLETLQRYAAVFNTSVSELLDGVM